MRLAASIVLASIFVFSGCRSGRTVLELFVVSADSGSDGVLYIRRSADLGTARSDPDTVARGLLADRGAPSLLHSTSWRWEKDGTIILTYLAWCDAFRFDGLQPQRLPRERIPEIPATNPEKPRPPEIRELDVIAHGLRHLSFLVQHDRDGRLAAALSPRSLEFFNSLCGQLAGNFDQAAATPCLSSASTSRAAPPSRQ